MNNNTHNEGIHINPSIIRNNETIELNYCGSLATNPSNDVYIHYGTSYLTDWANINDVKMVKNPNGNYSVNIDIPDGNTLNLCFRDSNNNWDNNDGNNYIYRIEK